MIYGSMLKILVFLVDWILEHIFSMDENANRERAIFLPKFELAFFDLEWPQCGHFTCFTYVAHGEIR